MAFLRARLDEDERAARQADDSPWESRTLGRHDQAAVITKEGSASLILLDGSRAAANDAHIARHDPARVLRQTAVLRDGVDLWSRMVGSHARACLRAVAAIWADHPDYREEWRS
ncbi:MULTISPECIES: DUF6221 family protein [unclassified Streptomyces]|uniref:DUF6221 family protein n=1 Tax=unclassified Streptomyces TaxID=2593676 RepID=UPI003D92FE20